MAEDSSFKPLRNSIKRRRNGSEDNLMAPYFYDGETSKAAKLTEREIHNIRYHYSIEVDVESCARPIRSFNEVNLPYFISKFLNNSRIIAPTAVQMQAIPILLSGKDLIAIASTGSGKTLSYLLPLFTFLANNVKKNCMKSASPTALIITPTRELMQQVYTLILKITESIKADEMWDLDARSSCYGKRAAYGEASGTCNDNGTYLNHEYKSTSSLYNAPLYHRPMPPGSGDLVNNHNHNFQNQNDTRYSVLGVCGGQPINAQIAMLSSIVDIVVATPGRLLELSEKQHVNLSNVSYFVIDECDKMLDMGLEEQLRRIIAIVTLHDMPRQTSLWSATLPSSLERLARSAVLDPVTIYVGSKDSVCNNVEQNIIYLHSYQKPKKLLQTLRTTQYPPVLIFVSSALTADELVELLKEEEFFTDGLHSKKSQDQRFQVISNFKNGLIDILVATDLASRGLDIPELTHVINYDTPNSIEDYVHRCGRTGRFGRPGTATTFLTLDCKIADDLKNLLESSGIVVPKALEDTKQFGKKVLKTEFGDRILP